MSVTVVKIFDPCGNINEKEILDFKEGLRLDQCLKNIPLNNKDLNFVISFRGDIIPKDTDLTKIFVKDGDIISVCANTEFTAVSALSAWVASAVVGGSVAFGTSVLYAAAYGLTFVGATLAMGYLGNAIISTLVPDIPSSSGSSSGSDIEQTYGWNELEQTFSEGTRIPYAFGKNRMAGHVLNRFIRIKNNKEYLYVLLGLTDHSLDKIDDIRINNQPVSYFKGVQTFTRLGGLNDELIPGFEDVVAQKDNGAVLVQGSPVTQDTDGTTVTEAVVIVTATKGLFSTNDEGGLDAMSATFNIEHKLKTEPDTSYVLYGSYTLSGATTEAQRKTITVSGLDAGQHTFRVTRTNAETTSFKAKNEITLVSIQEIIKQPFIYPGLAKYAVIIEATDQLSGGFPSITCMTHKDSVPVYDEDHETVINKRADNPAWMIWYLYNNFAKVNKDRLIWEDFKEWADYSDEDINGEYRFSINKVFTSGNFWDESQKIAKMGHAVIVPKTTKYGLYIDKQDDNVYHQFGMANIDKNSFHISYLEEKNRANAITLSYTDIERDYTKQSLTVYSNSYIVDGAVSQKATVDIEAAVNQRYVVSEGIFKINCNRHLVRVIQFTALRDSFGCVIGDNFYFEHETLNYQTLNISGYAISASNTLDMSGTPTPGLQLEKELTLEEGINYNVMVRIVSDEDTELFVEKSIINNPGVTDVLYVNSIWEDLPQDDALYFCGVATTFKKKYRMVGVAPTQDHRKRMITGFEYIDRIYTDDADYIIEEPEWEIHKQIAVSLVSNEFLVYSSDGGLVSNINISWHNGYMSVGSKWSIWLENITNFADWVSDQNLGGSSGSISGGGTLVGIIPTGWVVYALTGVTITGTRNVDGSWTLTSTGTCSFYQEGSGEQTINDENYRLSFGVSSITGNIEASIRKSIGNSDIFTHTIEETGVYNFVGEETEEGLKTPYFVLSTNESITFSFIQANQEGSEAIHIGDTFKNTFTVNNNLILGNTYKIYVSVFGEGAVNTGGNTDTIEIQGKLAPPENVENFVGYWDSIKRQVHFTWSANTELDIKEYIIVEGGSWDINNAKVITSANFASLFIDEGVSATVTYRIKAFDTSNIESVSETVIAVEIDTSDCPLATPGDLALVSNSGIAPDGTNVVYLLATWNGDSEVSDYWSSYDILLEDMVTNKKSGYSTTDREFQWLLIPNKQYGVSIRAKDVSGNKTPWTTQVLHTTTKDASPPAAPTWPVLSAAIGGFKVIGLNWNDNTEYDLSHYVIERSLYETFIDEDELESKIVLGEKKASFTSDNQGLSVGTEYFYRIKAVDTSGNESPYSSVVSATTTQVGGPDIAYNSISAQHIVSHSITAEELDADAITVNTMESANYIATDNTSGSAPTGFKFNSLNDTFDMAGMTYNPTDGLRILDPNGNAVLQLGNSINGNYVELSDGDIQFFYWNGVSHIFYKSLTRREEGTTQHGATVEIPGYFKERPYVDVIPKATQTFVYSMLMYEVDQVLQCDALNVVEFDPESTAVPKAELAGTGRWRFDTKALLVASSAGVWSNSTPNWTKTENVGMLYWNNLTLVETHSTGVVTSPADTTQLNASGNFSVSCAANVGGLGCHGLKIDVYFGISGQGEWLVDSKSWYSPYNTGAYTLSCNIANYTRDVASGTYDSYFKIVCYASAWENTVTCSYAMSNMSTSYTFTPSAQGAAGDVKWTATGK